MYDHPNEAIEKYEDELNNLMDIIENRRNN